MIEQKYYVYILLCSDGTYYTGLTSNLERRLYEHKQGVISTSYTFTRRPVRLVWSQSFEDEFQALEREQHIKGWTHAKKKALIEGDWDTLVRLSKSSSEK